MKRRQVSSGRSALHWAGSQAIAPEVGASTPGTETGYTYPHHLRNAAEDLPAAPGVYIFHGLDDALPLYIGKSVNVRQRVMAHLRTEDEARMLRQTQTIRVIRTAGELGALLLEASLIKSRQPLYNQRLRRTRQLCSWQWPGPGQPECPRLVDTRTVQFAHTPGLYGLFASRHAAQEALLALAEEHHLCHVVLGLEKAPAGKACFRHQIRRCPGACCGAEPLSAHQTRLALALQQLAVDCWPRPGAVAFTETCPLDARFVQHHVVRNWCYLGSASTLQEARLLDQANTGFDADGYKILCKPLLQGHLPLTWLD